MQRKKNTILDSAALGTGLAELVRPCNSTLRPAVPCSRAPFVRAVGISTSVSASG
jgi:hypothetical protein